MVSFGRAGRSRSCIRTVANWSGVMRVSCRFQRKMSFSL